MNSVRSTRRGDLMRRIAALQIELDKATSRQERESIRQQIIELTKQLTAA